MQEHGLKDFRSAKDKAGVRLGLEDKGALPEQPGNRVGHRRTQPDLPRRCARGIASNVLRQAALEVMRQLGRIRPAAGRPRAQRATPPSTAPSTCTCSATRPKPSAERWMTWACRTARSRTACACAATSRSSSRAIAFAAANSNSPPPSFRERGRGNAPLSPGGWPADAAGDGERCRGAAWKERAQVSIASDRG